MAEASVIMNALNTVAGSQNFVVWTPHSKNYYFKLKYVFGSWSHTISGIHPNIAETSYTSTYIIPLEVANQLPTSTSGKMTVYLYTYSDSACTKQVGNASSKAFTVTLPDSIKPVITSLRAELDNSANPEIAKWGVAVVGYTKVKLVATARGSYGSSIKSFSIFGTAYVDSVKANQLLYTGGKITSSGQKEFVVSTFDSRNTFSNGSSVIVDVLPYSKPTIKLFTASRSSSNSSEMLIKSDWSFSSVGGHNAATAELFYKKTTETNWEKYNGVISKGQAITLSASFVEDSSYNFRIVVTDTVGNKAGTETLVPTSSVLMDFKAGGKGMGIGKIAESDALEVALPTVFFSDNIKITVNGTTKIPLADYIRGVIGGIYS